MNNTLFAWIGNTDLKGAESDSGYAPIAQAVRERKYTDVVLLCNYEQNRWEIYEKWFESKFPRQNLSVYHVDLSSPTHFAEIYENAVKHLEEYTRKTSDTILTFHLSPGTPAMSAVWIIIANSRFPGKLIESSIEAGLKDVDFPFEISADYIPRLNSYVEGRIIDFSEGLPPDTPEFEIIIHKSKEMTDAVTLAKRSALFDVPLLITGESGTGKELFARAVWSVSERSEGPFIPVNCGAIPESLAESELFGHVKGAFTGAVSDRIGKIEAAEGGILFLDEIGELSKEIQVKLLRVLQDKEIYRVGSSAPKKVNFRVIAATNRDLLLDTSKGIFREDLFHRIAVAVIKLPALRDRTEDISLLADYYLEEINKDFRNQKGWTHKTISKGGLRSLTSYSWPGNVRELVNTLMRIAIWSLESSISSEDVEAALLGSNNSTSSVMDKPLGGGFDLEALLGEIATVYLERAMDQTKDNKSAAADLLGFKNYQTLSNWLKRYGMDGNKTDS
jgi:DNA-binding NtrC family response regulator